ncbi:MAG TPA: long-chain fatty acid--CoA ligase [Roseiarcus sp.]|jgi:long-chain acyl-CoA synthetase
MQLELTHGLHRQLRRDPDAVATVFGERRRTWRELAERSSRLSAALRALGMGKRDRVGLLGLNSDRYLEYMLGVWWGGGALNPVNTRWSAAEVAFSLDDCDTRILLVDEHFAKSADEYRARSKSLQHLIYFGEGEAPVGMLDGEGLIAQAEPLPDCHSGGEDLAGVFYTGGTTGFPKGVMLSHNALMGNAICCLLDVTFDDDEVVLAVAPLFHQAGMCIVVRALARGCRTVYVDAFDPPKVLKTIATERATFTLLVPIMLQRMIEHASFKSYDMSSLRKFIYGASPINENLLARLLEAFPKVDFYQGYGMTETGGPYTVLPANCHRSSDPADRARLRSAGRPVWGFEMRIADLNGDEVPSGQVGEIVARGASVMTGYWNREKETQEAFRDGWLRSGDMGYVDDDGFLFIVDRLKDMIVSGGENVYSAEVENALTQHPAVASCAVIGIPSERWGEQVHAVIVLREGAKADATELREHCRQFIAGYKCPVSVEFRDSLPVSGAGKLLKHVLREPYWSGHTRYVG